MSHTPADDSATTVGRRSILRAGLLGVAAVTAGTVAGAATVRRQPIGGGSAPAPSDIQHDIADRLGPVLDFDGTPFRFGPAYTSFVTVALTRQPSRADQTALQRALETLEGHYPHEPRGLFVTIGYGQPYLDRLPGGLLRAHLPRRTADGGPAFEEAVPSPNDVLPDGRGPAKRRWRVPVAIERNDLALTLRSDRAAVLDDVLAWLDGSGRLAGTRAPSPDLSAWRVTSRRLMFTVRGMPRRLADADGLAFAARVNPQSPMWMGFADQQANGAGPAAITTFLGTARDRMTTARAGDYLDRASVQHLSHTILDLDQFYLGDPAIPDPAAVTYAVRCQYMFRATPPPAAGSVDQFTDGGGPAFLPNRYLGEDDALRGARGLGTPDGVRRIGHLSAMQRASRSQSDVPLHIRADGPGYDVIDVPDGSRQPKLHFSIFMPTARSFAEMRSAGSAFDLAARHGVAAKDNGLERFLTTTRRQNFLVPPRRHRAYPLLELV